MKILLLGANGQVGWELRRSLVPLGDIIACDRNSVDLENLRNLRTAVREIAPTIIVNAAAYTMVDKAESHVEQAHRVNAEAVQALAEEARRLGAWLVHYSTDYVFDGTKSGAYAERDEPNPLNTYGRTKLEGEQAIRATEGCRHIIFRTSWVFSSRGSNFIKTILRLAKERDELRVVSDQIGGTYHLVPRGETAWYRYAEFVLRMAADYGGKFNMMSTRVVPITTAEYPSPARRPLNSRLDTGKLITTFGVALPAWEMHVARAVAELVEGGLSHTL